MERPVKSRVNFVRDLTARFVRLFCVFGVDEATRERPEAALSTVITLIYEGWRWSVPHSL
jgi:hypothetical protein